MQLISILLKNRIKEYVLLTLLCVITGILHVFLLIVINNSLTSLMETDTTSLHNMAVAFSLLIGYLILGRLSSGFIVKYSLGVVNNMRIDIMRTTLKRTYSYMLDNGDRISSAITKDAVTLSRAAITSTQIITSCIVVIGCFIYLAYLSLSISLGILLISTLAILAFILTSKKNEGFLDNARKSEDSLFFHVKQIINGFKEIKMNQRKGTEILEDALMTSSDQHIENSYKGYMGYYNSAVIGYFLIYSGLILLAFIGKDVFDYPASLLVSSIIVLLYLINPLAGIANMVPQLVEGNVAACRLNDLMMTSSSGDDMEDVTVDEELDLDNVSLNSIQFKYPSIPDDHPFVLEDVNLAIEKNKITFIYGGNGAGKTTLLCLACGLLKPQGGEIIFNSAVHKEVPRVLISPVFNDFHLFDKLYGIKDIDYELAEYYLDLFELTEKVSMQGNQFSTTRLSTGQRKRLALINALLEKRPIIVLDEWAADQDPIFREKFYLFILPLLKGKGFTIVAITHDDKFYSSADSLYYMDKGKVEKKW